MPTKDLLQLRDLTDPAEGHHALQLVVDTIETVLGHAWAVPVRRHRGARIVTVAENYDRLRYQPDAVTRDRRYSHYLDGDRMLRSHTTAHVPALLHDLARHSAGEVVLSVPGLCHRRDVIDRVHVGDPHQLDLWRVRPAGPALTEADLEEMVRLVVAAVLPGWPSRTVPNVHPYTLAGREIYVDGPAGPVEVGECGLAHPQVLAGSGLPAQASGLAMGLGLDRLTMLVKGIDDIRLLRCDDRRVREQLTDLTPYRPVSNQPPVRRDLSLAVDAGLDAELLGDRVRELLGPDASAVQEVRVLADTGYDDLPDSARARMGLRSGQKNLLVRIVLCDLDRTLTAAQANRLRDRVYRGLHEGDVSEWAAAAP